MYTLRVAFAVNSINKFEKKHFGDADKYLIYQFQGDKFHYYDELINQAKDLDESNIHGSKLKGTSIISFLKNKGVNVLVSRQFGKNIKMVNKHFIPVIIATENIDEASLIIVKNLKWLIEDLQKDTDNYKLFNLRSGSLKEEIKTNYNEN
ncbi:MAG: hypothetical protein JW717_11535 [Marinilabiliaceae bacterium]|nr:hypothetical protein [Marinilabiliaceae bacterium]